MENQKLKFEH